jgi:hypothetical protein
MPADRPDFASNYFLNIGRFFAVDQITDELFR